MDKFSHDMPLSYKRMSLRSTEPELREFEQRLRNIYISQNQICQMKEKEYRKQLEKSNKKHEICTRTTKQIEEQNDRKWKSYEDEKNKLTYGKELLSQVDLKRQQNSCLKDQIKHEIKVNEHLQKRILEDEERKKMEKTRKKNEAIYEMSLFNAAKDMQIKKKQIIQLCELKKIEQTKKEQDERLRNRLEEDNQKSKLKESIRNQISSNLLAQKMGQQERIQLIQQLREHEYIQSQSKSLVDEGAQKQFNQESIRNILKLQIDANVLREKNLRDEENKYKKQLSVELEVLDHKQKKKIIEHEHTKSQYADELKKQIKDDLEKRQRQQGSVKEIDDYVKQYNENIQEQIREEKLRLLDEYSFKTIIV